MKVLKSHWPEKYQEEKDVETLKVDQVGYGRGSSKHSSEGFASGFPMGGAEGFAHFLGRGK